MSPPPKMASEAGAGLGPAFLQQYRDPLASSTSSASSSGTSFAFDSTNPGSPCSLSSPYTPAGPKPAPAPRIRPEFSPDPMAKLALAPLLARPSSPRIVRSPEELERILEQASPYEQLYLRTDIAWTNHYSPMDELRMKQEWAGNEVIVTAGLSHSHETAIIECSRVLERVWGADVADYVLTTKLGSSTS